MGFESAYRSGEPLPWDIGGAQPVIVALAERGEIGGRVLDVGCGTGENGIFLASRGLDVVGIDAAPTAIARARTKATERGIEVRFEVGDVLELDARALPFDSAIDCGLFHTFEDAERPRFERSLRRVLRTGARYFLLCFSELEPGDWGPRRVTQEEIRATFAGHWRVDSIEEARFAARRVEEGARAWLAALTLMSHR